MSWEQDLHLANMEENLEEFFRPWAIDDGNILLAIYFPMLFHCSGSKVKHWYA